MPHRECREADRRLEAESLLLCAGGFRFTTRLTTLPNLRRSRELPLLLHADGRARTWSELLLVGRLYILSHQLPPDGPHLRADSGRLQTVPYRSRITLQFWKGQ